MKKASHILKVLQCFLKFTTEIDVWGKTLNCNNPFASQRFLFVGPFLCMNKQAFAFRWSWKCLGPNALTILRIEHLCATSALRCFQVDDKPAGWEDLVQRISSNRLQRATTSRHFSCNVLVAIDGAHGNIGERVNRGISRNHSDKMTFRWMSFRL